MLTTHQPTRLGRWLNVISFPASTRCLAFSASVQCTATRWPKAFEGKGLGEVCPVEQSLLYSYLRNLEGRDLIRWKEQRVGRRPPRKQYSLAAAGTKKANAWLAAPVPQLRQVRYEFLVKLYILHDLDRDAERTLVQAQVDVCDEYLQSVATRLSNASENFEAPRRQLETLCRPRGRPRGSGSTSTNSKKSAMRRLATSFGLGVAVVASMSCGASSQTVDVYAASSLNDLFRALGEAFEAEHEGVRVRFNFAASSALATQIRQGAPGEVMASANLTIVADLATDGFLTQSRPFATTTMVVAVRKDESRITSLADLAKPGLILVLASEGRSGRRLRTGHPEDGFYRECAWRPVSSSKFWQMSEASSQTSEQLS